MRMTRAALRAQAHDDTEPQPTATTMIHEDGDADALQTSNNEDSDGADNDSYPPRPVLKDITHENYTTAEEINATESHPKAEGLDLDEQTAPAPTKKTRGRRKGKQNKKERLEGTAEEDAHTSKEREGKMEEHPRIVAEDMGSSDTSVSSEDVEHQEQPEEPSLPISEETEDRDTSTAPETVHGPTGLQNAVSDHVLNEPRLEQPHQLHDLTSTPNHSLQSSTPIMEEIRNDPPKTPKFDPSIHAPTEDIASPAVDTAEDSFVEKIKTRSPSKIQGSTEVSSSDGSVEDFMTRTPRIEDSVEAIDALEDAIERVSEDLPVLGELQIESPVKPRKNTPTRQPTRSTVARSTVTRSSGPQNPTIARVSAPKPASKGVAMTKQAKNPIIDRTKPRESMTSSHPPLSFSNTQSKTLANASQNTMHKRAPSTRLSTAKPAFIPAKSTKPPTKPTFSLPGEAISAKLKAQREERLKREEEAEKERKQFKARPVPTKTARPSVLPRENKASQARMSLYASGVNKENVAPKIASAPAGAPHSKPRPSSFCAKPSSDQTKASSGVRRATSVVERPPAAKTRVSSLQLASGQKSTVTKDEVAQQKVKGKEVFSRNKAELERLEKERKEKEEATRKARAAAAERGRQASREWAEKQKKKMAMQNAAKGSAQLHSTAIAASS